MHEFNQSLKYDRRMYDADIRGSIAYARSLARVGILTKDEEEKIATGLTAVGEEWKKGTVSGKFSSVVAQTKHNSSSSLRPTMKTSTLRTNAA
jgi:argininosuccinate lyase